jgi:hypothetical protein
MFGFNIYRINTKILCRFMRRDKSVKKKWVKPRNGERVEFDGGWYYVITKRILFETMMFMPAKVLEFSYKSIYPRDPETGEANAETPEARRNLNKREDIEALEVGSQRALGKVKVGVMSGGWLPIILVVGVVACLYFVWQMRGQIDAVGQALNVLQEMMMKSGMLK